MDELFADPETGMPSRALGLLGEKALEERLNRLEDQVRFKANSLRVPGKDMEEQTFLQS